MQAMAVRADLTGRVSAASASPGEAGEQATCFFNAGGGKEALSPRSIPRQEFATNSLMVVLLLGIL